MVYPGRRAGRTSARIWRGDVGGPGGLAALVVDDADRARPRLRGLIIVRTKLGPCAPYSQAVRTT